MVKKTRFFDRTDLQSVVFNKKYWTLEKTKKYIIDRELKLVYRNKPVHITATSYRYRQRDPNVYYRYITKKSGLPKGISYIIGFHK